MKVLILNQDWFAKELRDAGHEVLTVGIARHLDHVLPAPMLHLDTVLNGLSSPFSPDLILWLDNSAPCCVCGLEDGNVPVIMYSVDTHHHAELHSCLARCADHVFVAQKDFIPDIAATGIPTSWLPLWPSRDVEASNEKHWDVSFVGTMDAKLNPLRVAFFDTLAKKIPIHIEQGRYWDIFPHSEIVINQTVKGDLNFRVFETMMCGSLLLTEKTENGLLDIFRDGEHLVTYERNNPDDAVAQAYALLANRPRMRAIAHAGREEVLKSHQATHRLETVLAAAKNLTRRPSSAARHFGAMVNYVFLASLVEETDTAIYTKALVASLRAAETGLHLNGYPTDTQCANIIWAAIRYDRLFKTGAGQLLIETFAEAFPEIPLLRLAVIRSLLNTGRVGEARKVALLASDKTPEETFTAAEQVITMVLEMLGQ